MKKVFFGIGLFFTLSGISLIGSPSFFDTQSEVQAQQLPVLEFFHGAECPHCHEEKKWFPELKKMYPALEIKEFEVWHDAENRKLWAERMAEFNMKPTGVPTNIFEDTVIVGFDKKAILSAIEKSLGPPKDNGEKIEEIKKEPNGWKKYLEYSWPVMSFILGIVDGFNPCAMWTLLILIGFLLTMDDRKKMWLIGGVFIGSSGIIYAGALLAYLFGFSQISTFLATTAFMEWIFRAVGILALGAGGLSIWSARKAQIECEVRDADSKKRFHLKMSEVLNRENFIMVLLGIIGLAFSVNAVELLCSFAIPTTFTATLISLQTSLIENLVAIFIYTMAYMLDDIIVFCIAMWTLSLTVFSPKIVRVSHFVGGIVLLILGAILLIKPAILTTLTT